MRAPTPTLATVPAKILLIALAIANALWFQARRLAGPGPGLGNRRRRLDSLWLGAIVLGQLVNYF